MELFSLLAKLTLDSSEYTSALRDAQNDADSFSGPEDQTLSLDTQDFDTNIGQSQSLGTGFGDTMGSVFTGIKDALTMSGIAMAISGIVSNLKEMVNMTAETADQIDKGSRTLGISTESYQAWDHALRQSGSGIMDLQKGVLQFNKYLSGEKTEEMADAFKQLGVNADEAGMTTEKLINETLLALADFDGTNEDRGTLVTKLFGRGGLSFNALLDEGKEGVKDLLNEASNLGLIMSEDEIKNAVAYGDAVQNLQAELDAIKSAFVADIIPVLTDATKWVTQFITQLNPRIENNSLIEVIENINRKASEASTGVDQATASAKKLIEDLAAMGDYWQLDEQGKMTWDALAEKALELFPQLSNYIDTDGKKIQGNTEDIEANIDAWARLEKQRILSDAMSAKRAAVANQLTEAYTKAAEAAGLEADAEGKKGTAIDQLNEVLKNNDDLRNLISSNFNGITQVDESNAADVFDYLKNSDFGLPMGVEALEEWINLQTQAENARAEATRMIEEAEAANSRLGEDEKRLAKEMGYTDDDLKKIEDQKETAKKLADAVQFYRDLFPTVSSGDGFFPEITDAKRIVSKTKEESTGGILNLAGYGINASEHAAEWRESELYDKIVAAIKDGMAGVTVDSYLDGRKVTEEVKRKLTVDLYAGGYTE